MISTSRLPPAQQPVLATTRRPEEEGGPAVPRFLPQRGRRTSSSSERTPGLPADLLRQSANRGSASSPCSTPSCSSWPGSFRRSCFQADRTLLFSGFHAVGARARSRSPSPCSSPRSIRSARVPLPIAMHIGLVFEVASQLRHRRGRVSRSGWAIDVNVRWLGLSWVAVVDAAVHRRRADTTAPRGGGRARVGQRGACHDRDRDGARASRRSVRSRCSSSSGSCSRTCSSCVMAYVGARVVYALGTEVSRARELGSYRLVERLGKEGWARSGVPSTAARSPRGHQAHSTLLTADGALGGVRGSAAPVRARGAGDCAPPLAAHREPLRFRHRRRRRLLLRDGTARGTRRRDARAAHGPIPAERAIHLLRQVCHSLSEAESCGLVHRDIKPANIFLCRYGEEYDFVKVLDFGIAKTAHDTADTGLTLTRDHGRAGHAGVHCPGAGDWEEPVSMDAPTSTPRAVWPTGC